MSSARILSTRFLHDHVHDHLYMQADGSHTRLPDYLSSRSPASSASKLSGLAQRLSLTDNDVSGIESEPFLRAARGSSRFRAPCRVSEASGLCPIFKHWLHCPINCLSNTARAKGFRSGCSTTAKCHVACRSFKIREAYLQMTATVDSISSSLVHMELHPVDESEATAALVPDAVCIVDVPIPAIQAS